MLYAVLCYNLESVVGLWTKEQDDAVMVKHEAVMQKLAVRGKLGPVARLMPTTAATTVRAGRDQGAAAGLLHIRLRDARRSYRDGARPDRGNGRVGNSPGREFLAGGRRKVNDVAWIDAALTAARPQALGALLRYFRGLDTAEEAFQEACLRALKNWPVNGPPRDPAAWLILVGRNVALDEKRRQSRHEALPDEELVSDLDDAETNVVDRLDSTHYRDDLLRLMFICCHPELPATQQIALALRLVSGLSVKEIARAFLVGESAMEQRITRAKRRVAAAEVPFETPGAVERAERLGAVAAMIYLLFNEGYSASGGTVHVRVPLCEEAIRLARLLLRVFPGEPEIMGLMALLLLQHARTPARLDAEGAIILLEDQDRARWNRAMIAEGLALLDKALRHRRPGPYQVQAAISGVHAHAARAEDTDWAEIEQLYAVLETLLPSPVITLNRAVAVSKVQGPAAALAMIEALAAPLEGYFHFFGVKGALLIQLGHKEEARIAFDRAIALANTTAEAAHIRLHLDRLIKDSEASADGPVSREPSR
jgi:RNA polymerase sigma-70 factor (ECF subfamily)